MRGDSPFCGLVAVDEGLAAAVDLWASVEEGVPEVGDEAGVDASGRGRPRGRPISVAGALWSGKAGMVVPGMGEGADETAAISFSAR